MFPHFSDCSGLIGPPGAVRRTPPHWWSGPPMCHSSGLMRISSPVALFGAMRAGSRRNVRASCHAHSFCLECVVYLQRHDPEQRLAAANRLDPRIVCRPGQGLVAPGSALRQGGPLARVRRADGLRRLAAERRRRHGPGRRPRQGVRVAARHHRLLQRQRLGTRRGSVDAEEGVRRAAARTPERGPCGVSLLRAQGSWLQRSSGPRRYMGCGGPTASGHPIACGNPVGCGDPMHCGDPAIPRATAIPWVIARGGSRAPRRSHGLWRSHRLRRCRGLLRSHAVLRSDGLRRSIGLWRPHGPR